MILLIFHCLLVSFVLISRVVLTPAARIHFQRAYNSSNAHSHLNKGNAGVLSICDPSDYRGIVSLEIGVSFHNGKHFKDSLQNFAIECNFNFTITKNNKQRVTVQCDVEDCQWCVHTP